MTAEPFTLDASLPATHSVCIDKAVLEPMLFKSQLRRDVGAGGNSLPKNLSATEVHVRPFRSPAVSPAERLREVTTACTGSCDRPDFRSINVWTRCSKIYVQAFGSHGESACATCVYTGLR